MTDDLRWAVRYAFAEDLWRDENRVIVDASLEAALRGMRRTSPNDGPLAELVDGLVPRVPKARAWVAVTDEAVARELAQTRPGTGFLPRGSFADVVAHRDWAVALVELSALQDSAPGGTRLREQLAERAAEGRTVVVSAPSKPQGEDDAGFAALSELVDGSLGGGRIYGVYRPPMAAVVDFGGDEDEDQEVPLSFDNTLGTQSPGFVEYVAVAGKHPPLPEGMTLVELPARTPSGGSDDELLRDQLLSAQRQAELAVIDRQALLEKVDQLESARERQDQQASELRDQLARAVTESGPEDGAGLQASLADNQALRWKVQQLERELEGARARPVEALEAEVAALRAQIAGTGARPVDAPAPSEVSSADEEDEVPTLVTHVRSLDETKGKAPVEATPVEATPEDDESLEVPTLVAHVGSLREASSDASNEDRSGDETQGKAADTSAEAEAEAGAEVAAEEPGEASDEASDEAVEVAPEPTSHERVEWMRMESEDRAERRRVGSALADLDRLIAQVERGGIEVLSLRQALVSIRERLRG